MEKILVVGGTGEMGMPVARRLKADGYDVRVFTRSPEKARALFDDSFEVAVGDVGDPPSIEAAMEGCRGVHVNLAGGPSNEDYDRVEHRGTANVAAAAAKMGLERMTYLSGSSVSKKNRWYVCTDVKFQAEEAIRASGVPHTIFRATWFMESIPRYVRGKSAWIIGKQPNLLHFVAVDDYAAMVSNSYGTTRAVGKTLFIHGPEAYTLFDALTVYCKIAHPGFKPTRVPFWLASLMAMGESPSSMAVIIPALKYWEKTEEGGDPIEANALLGAPKTTLETWSRRRAAQMAREAVEGEGTEKEEGE